MSLSVAARKNKLLILGILLILSGLIIIAGTFVPVAKEEIKYAVRPKKQQEIIPVSTDFGIVIPKIGANAKVIPNVDPLNEKEYQIALTKGVAQAKGTAFPGQLGNIFIFAHSAGDIFQANQYNAVFYLLGKLSKNDEIDLYYKSQKYKYFVTDAKIVEATDIKYLAGDKNLKTVTLMTCWPAGTTLKRFVILATFSP